MSIAQFASGDAIAFILIASISITSAIFVVNSKEIFHAGLFLALNLVSIGMLYFLLASEFIGASQILIYGGGVIVLLLFSIILTKREKEYSEELPFYSKLFRTIFVLLMIGIISKPIFASKKLFEITGAKGIEVAKGKLTYLIGYYLFTEYIIPFEIVGLALLAALLGGVSVIKLYRSRRWGESP